MIDLLQNLHPCHVRHAPEETGRRKHAQLKHGAVAPAICRRPAYKLKVLSSAVVTMASWSNSRFAAAIVLPAAPPSAASQSPPACRASMNSECAAPQPRAAAYPRMIRSAGTDAAPYRNAHAYSASRTAGSRSPRASFAAAAPAEAPAMRRWPCRSAEAAPGTDRSRDTQKATSAKSRIALHESAMVAAQHSAAAARVTG